MAAPAGSYSAYKQIDVETTSQGKLVVMLFNGAIQRAEEAKRQLEKGSINGVHNNLIRAQDIIAELRTSLDMSTGEIAANLDRIYEYFQHLLVKANVQKSPEPIGEAVTLMTEMRDTWKEVFAKEESQATSATRKPVPPPMNQHGSKVMNLQG